MLFSASFLPYPIVALFRFGCSLFTKLFYELMGTWRLPVLDAQCLHEEHLLPGSSNHLSLRSSCKCDENNVPSIQRQRLFQGITALICTQRLTNFYFKIILGFFNSPSSLKRSLYLVQETRYGTDGTSFFIISIFPPPWVYKQT